MKTNKPKHTPGPWINNAGQIEHRSVLTNDPDFGLKIVATVNQVNNQSLSDTANARLIAAAPEMLQEIKETIVAIIDFQRQCEEDEYTDTDLVHDLLDNIFVDLKRIEEKAEGEVES